MDVCRAIVIFDAVWDGTSYRGGGVPSGEIFSKRDGCFDEFVDRLYLKNKISKSSFELKLYTIVQCDDGNGVRVPIIDDSGLAFLAAAPLLVPKIYVEKLSTGVVDATVNVVDSLTSGKRCETSDRVGFMVSGDKGDTYDSFESPVRAASGDLSDRLECQEQGLFDENIDFSDEDFRDVHGTGIPRDLDSGDEFDDDLHLQSPEAVPRQRSPSLTPEPVLARQSQHWELPGMSGYSFGEPQIYALSTPYQLTGLCKGSTFESKEEMSVALGKYVLKKKYTSMVKESNSVRYEVVCASGQKKCEFAFRARSEGKGVSSWHVTHFHPECSCLSDPDRPFRKQPTAKVLGSIFAPRLHDPTVVFRASTVRSEVDARFSVELNYSKAYRALKYAEKLTFGSFEESWQYLPKYFKQLEIANPGTKTDIKVDSQGHFLYSFFALGQSIEGFKKYMRPIIAADATHLKSGLSGCIYVAMAFDGNESLFPIAYGFGNGEDGDGWKYFFHRLRKAIGEPENLVIITDRGTSIPAAVKKFYPRVPHVFCYRHLKANLLRFCRRRIDVQDMLYEACYTHSKKTCKKKLREIKSSCPRLHDELESIGIERWSMSHCPRRRFTMTTNIAESTNAAIMAARKLPITAAHEHLRALTQKWYSEKREAAYKSERSIAGGAIKKLDKMAADVEACSVRPIIRNVKYQVIHEKGTQEIVSVHKRSCTCGKWDLELLPCEHALAYARHERVRVSGLCNPYYSVEYLRKAYHVPINPVPHINEWKDITTPDETVVLPMLFKKQAGRPKRKRIPSVGEFPRPKKCSKCGEPGHSVLTCRQNPPPTFAYPSVPSSVGSTSAQNSDNATSLPRRKSRCQRCMETGHNSRTCTMNSTTNANSVEADASQGNVMGI